MVKPVRKLGYVSGLKSGLYAVDHGLIYPVEAVTLAASFWTDGKFFPSDIARATDILDRLGAIIRAQIGDAK